MTATGPALLDGTDAQARLLERLLVWIRWGCWLAIILSGLGVASALQNTNGNHRGTWSLAFYLFVALPLVELALREVRRDQISRAFLLASVLLWLPGVFVALINPQIATVGVLSALLPAVFGIPYTSRRTHRVIILVSAVFGVAIAGLGALEHDFFPTASDAELTSLGVFLPIGLFAILMTFAAWHAAERLRGAIGALVQTNDELATSERELESKVAERTAELSQRTDELSEARDAALKASRTKSTFLANMSHELRTPMNAIIGYSEMLTEEAEDDGATETVEDLKKIQSAGHHLLSLINDILDLSKIEAGRMELHLESFGIAEMVAQVASTVESLVAKKGNRLSVELDPDLGEMHADVTKVRQSLLNLLSNASKFTHDGRIELRVSRFVADGTSWISMAVSDSGIGIPAEKIEHVFEEFAQADETTTRDYGGTGLGLPISQRFCRMMGGDITAESLPGEGSTFTIQLPRDVRPARVAESADEPSVATSSDTHPGATILSIDDDAQALELLRRTLEAAGMRVVTANNGEEGLRLARSLRPDAITLDIMMPAKDGWEVLRELKDEPSTREIPVLIVTMTDDRQLGWALGASEFVTKPIDRARLVEMLRRYSSAGQARCALIVDDDPAARILLRRSLEIEGWSEDEAENGREALDKVDASTPAQILLDLLMPVMDGFEFVAEMRSRSDTTSPAIVVVTGKDIDDQDRRRLSGGIAGLIEKRGLDRDALLEQVRDHLREAALPPGQSAD